MATIEKTKTDMFYSIHTRKGLIFISVNLSE